MFVWRSDYDDLLCRFRDLEGAYEAASESRRFLTNENAKMNLALTETRLDLKKTQYRMKQARQALEEIHGKCELYQFNLTENDEPETE